MAQFPVTPEKASRLAARMRELGVEESEIDETFVRSSGHGGQNVNKVATCVMLTHRPTGLQVRCQDTRRQGMNRFLARHLLLDKLDAARMARAASARARREKLRRQKRKRSRAVKERMLADKSHQSEKKQRRQRVEID